MIFDATKAKKLAEINLKSILLAKNPYLYRAKNITVAADLIRSILDAKLFASGSDFWSVLRKFSDIHITTGMQRSEVFGSWVSWNSSVKECIIWSQSSQVPRHGVTVNLRNNRRHSCKPQCRYSNNQTIR